MSQLGFLPNYKMHFGYFNHKKGSEIISNYANTSLSHFKKKKHTKIIILQNPMFDHMTYEANSCVQ